MKIKYPKETDRKKLVVAAAEHLEERPSAKFNMSSVVHMTNTAVNLTRNLSRAVK